MAGHLKQLYGVDSLPWHQYLNETYGRVMKIKGFMGVRSPARISCERDSDPLPPIQDTQLVSSAPKALHHILVKDQQNFMETDFFIE